MSDNYYLKLSSAVNVIVAPQTSVITDAIGPFNSAGDAHAWFVSHADWLDNRGIKHVTTEHMAMPI